MEYDRDPSYVQLVTDIAEKFSEYSASLTADDLTISSITKTVLIHWNFSTADVIFPLIAALLIFALKQIIQVILNAIDLTNFKPVDAKKLPESVFQLIIYSGLWILESKIVLDNDFLVNPSKTFRNWSEKREEPMPTDAYWLYITVIGFYIQALVCCILVDERRKDTHVMILHHIATLFLVVFSFGMRFWAIGCLVLFCHDICDIFLDISKLFLYFQNRIVCSKPTWYICEIAKSISFALFVLSWVWFRFNLYPRKAVYGAAYHSMVQIDGGPPVYPFYSFLLMSIQVMHIYWFWFIFKLLLKILTGEKLRDTRENEEEETAEKKTN